MKKYIFGLLISLIVGSATVAQSAEKIGAPFEHVILISVDGLRGDAISHLSPQDAPNFYEIIKNGATTMNARTDVDFTVTMPNHTCMFTGLGVLGEKGHNYTANNMVVNSLHQVKGRYVPSVFDVVHENNLQSAFFATKSKFMLYPKSYGGKGIDQPKMTYQDKYLIDSYAILSTSDDKMVDLFLEELGQNAPQFMFLHISGPDKVGHKKNWDVTPGSAYLNEVKNIDALVGRVLQAVQRRNRLVRTTAVIITSDHGGFNNDHQDAKDPRDYTIPFLVWGEHITQADLYALNPTSRKDPGQEQVSYESPGQPIRNGDAGNLALSLLGLPSIPGSTINNRQDLNVLP